MLTLLKCVPRKLVPASPSLSTISPASNWVEVGKLVEPKKDGNYDTGQLFLHQKLDYRGAILFPWPVRQFDRDSDGFPESFDKTLKEGDTDNLPKLDNYHGNPVIYYQVIIDYRDFPYSLFQREGVTFLGKKREFYTVPGLDYVSHDDILPYTITSHTNKDPIYHNLFKKFLEKLPDTDETGSVKYNGTSILVQWLEDNYKWLQLRDIHIQTTQNVKVTVYSFYMGSREEHHGVEHWWRYSILIQNMGEVSVQLRERNWCVFSSNGIRESVTGKGIIGQEPILKKSESFQYSSHVSLRSMSGHMWGTYIMERDDGVFITVNIPPFLLVSDPSDE